MKEHNTRSKMVLSVLDFETMCTQIQRVSGEHDSLLTDTLQEELRVLAQDGWGFSRALKMWNIIICSKDYADRLLYSELRDIVDRQNGHLATNWMCTITPAELETASKQRYACVYNVSLSETQKIQFLVHYDRMLLEMTPESWWSCPMSTCGHASKNKIFHLWKEFKIICTDPTSQARINSRVQRCMGPQFCRTVVTPTNVSLLPTPSQSQPTVAKGIYSIHMSQDATTHDIGRFTQDVELSLLCQKNQTDDLPLSTDPNLATTVNVQLQVKIMCATLKNIDDERDMLAKLKDKLPATSSQKRAAKVAPAKVAKKCISKMTSPKKSNLQITTAPSPGSHRLGRNHQSSVGVVHYIIYIYNRRCFFYFHELFLMKSIH